MDDLGFKPIEQSEVPAQKQSFPPLEVLPQRAIASAEEDLGFQPIVKEEETVSHAPPEVRGDEELGFKPVGSTEKYASEGQIALGLAEKFAKGVLPSPVVTGVERALGVSPEEMKGREEYLGGYGTAAEMAGFVAGAFVPFGYAKLLSKVGGAALKGAGMAGEAATLGEKVARGVVSQVPEMAAFGAINEIDKYLMQKPQTASSVIAGVTLNAVLGGAFGAGVPVVAAGLSKIPLGPLGGKLAEILNGFLRRTRAIGDGYEIAPLTRRILKIFGHVPEETQDAYIKERQQVLAMPEYMEVHEIMSEKLTSIYERLATAKLSVKEAAKEFKEAVNKTTDSIIAQGKDAKTAREAAEDMLAEQVIRIQKELEQEVVDSAAPRIMEALEALQTSRNELSAGARQVLENTPGATSLTPFLQAIDEMIANRRAATDTFVAETLQKYRKDLVAQYPTEIPYNKVKDVLQTIGRKGKWAKFQTEELNAPSRYFESLFRVLDRQVKEEVPAYAQEMLPTAEAAELFNNFKNIKGLPDIQKLALNLTNKANYVKWMPLLRQVEAQTGISFVDQLEKYINPEHLAKLEQALPETAKISRLRDLEESLKLLVSGKVPLKAMEEGIEAAGLKAARQEEIMAEAAVAGLKGVRPSNIDAVMKRAMKGNRVAIKQLENLGYMAIPIGETVKVFSIPEVLRLLKIRESFEKGAKNGTRNIFAYSNVGRAAGAGLGAITGFFGIPEHSLLGAGSLTIAGERLGNLAGAAADFEAPSWVKWFLDKQLDKYGEWSTMIGEKTPDNAKSTFIHIFGEQLEMFKNADPRKIKATAEFIEKQRTGEKLIEDGAKMILLPGKVLPKEFLPDPKKAKETDEKAKEFETNPLKVSSLTDGISFLPEYSAQLTTDVMRIVGLINQYRPKPQQMGVFDKPIEPSNEDKRMFQVGLEFADQPLSIYSKIKNASLLPQDVMMFQALHPEMHQEMKKQVLSALLENQEKNKKIPYRVRQSLSLFLGMDLDGSTAPQNIQAAQAVFAQQKMQMQGAVQGAPASKTKALAKTSQNYETPEQASEFRRRQG